MRVLFVLAALAPLAAQPTDPTALLGRVLLKVAAGVKVIPNYTCVETLTRDYYNPIAPISRRCDVLLAMKQNPTLDMDLRHTSTDRLRLDVGMTKTGEVFSWAGATRFDDRRIDEIAPEGPVGSGAFGAMLSMVFAQDVQTFRFERQTIVNDQPRLEYSFDVPVAKSHYRVKITSGWITTAYHGRFEIDPAREEVTRLWVESAVLPPAATTCVTRTQVDYSPISIGAGVFPMATRVQQQFVSGDGRETVNRIAFSNCREYRGESSIRFGQDGASENGHSGPHTENPAPIPGGLDIILELTEAIDSAVAAAGDRFVARLARPLRDGKKVIAPAGSRVEGRIVRLQITHRPEPETVVVLRPEFVETQGVRLRLSATRDRRREPEPARGARTRILLPTPQEGFAGVFRVAGPNAVLPKGFRSDWRTAPR